MFRFIQTGPERGDCTAPYKVEMDCEYTVRSFVEEAITRNDGKDWGYIGVYKYRVPHGEPCIEYRWGKSVGEMPEKILDLKVLSATADGGWSRMDYIMVVEGIS